MLVKLRRQYAQFIISGAQLLLLVVGLKINTVPSWQVILSAMMAISLIAWISALYRMRTIRDTPTSKIVSAAQGYVELTGQGKAYSDVPLLSKNLLLPCLWYRYIIEYKDSNNKWKTIENGESEDLFILDDGSGRCVIDPSGAEILTRHKDTWQKNNHRYTEWKLLAIDTLYVLGQFKTVGGSSTILDANEELKAVLTEWKQDTKTLNERFDLNYDGVLDLQEWMLARLAAKRTVEKNLAHARNQPDTHFLLQPQDQSLFLISNLSPDSIARRYWWWSWIHLLIFFGALCGMAWL